MATRFRVLDPSWVERLAGERWFTASGGPLPDGTTVCFRLGVSADGRLVVTGLFLGATESDGEGRARHLDLASNTEVTSRLLRAVPVGELVSWVTRNAGLNGPWSDYFASLPKVIPQVPAVRARPGPRGHPPEHYRAVAEAWMVARRLRPRAPMKAFLDANPWAPRTESTIYRWIGRARELGLLPESY